MIRNLNSAANMSQTTWSDHIGKDPKLCGQAHLASLTPDPHTSVFVLKIQVFACRLSLANLLFEWRISLWSPRAPAGLHSVLWSRAGSAYTWASSQPDGPPGGVGVDSWIFKTLVNIWGGFVPDSPPRGSLDRRDTMGCCSGRCTLAFICGMQLVSVRIIIVITKGVMMEIDIRCFYDYMEQDW